MIHIYKKSLVPKFHVLSRFCRQLRNKPLREKKIYKPKRFDSGKIRIKLKESKSNHFKIFFFINNFIFNKKDEFILLNFVKRGLQCKTISNILEMKMVDF